jgi:hypothetical protein
MFLETLYRIYSTAGYNIAHIEITAEMPRASVQGDSPFQEADFSAHPRRGSGELRTWLRCARKAKPVYLNRRLLGESWSTAVQPISFIPLSISARISPSACSTPA